MAVVSVTILEGRDEETLARLHQDLAAAVINVLDAKPHQVRTVIHQIPPEAYAIGGKALPANALEIEAQRDSEN